MKTRSVNMNVIKISDIDKPFTKVVVTVYTSKKRYFSDSEVTGWLLTTIQDEIHIYHLYQRGFDTENHKTIEEPLIEWDQPLVGIVRETEIETMLNEAALQHQTGENKELFGQLKRLIK